MDYDPGMLDICASKMHTHIKIGLRVLHLASFVQGFRELVRLRHLLAWLFLYVPHPYR